MRIQPVMPKFNFKGTIAIKHKPREWNNWRDGNGVQFTNFDYRANEYGVDTFPSLNTTYLDTDHIKDITDDEVIMEDKQGNEVAMRGLYPYTLTKIKSAYEDVKAFDKYPYNVKGVYNASSPEDEREILEEKEKRRIERQYFRIDWRRGIPM